ncbi:MAG TPA: hypothetical protein VGK71_05320 [Nitrospirota bacterium]
MKKFMLAVVAAALVLTSSAAMAEVTVGGGLALRYEYWKNLKFNNTSAKVDDTQSFLAVNVKLNVDAKIAEGLETFIELQTQTTGANLGNTAATGAVPNNSNAALNYFNFQKNDMHVNQAWVNFTLPGTTVGIKAGHQPIALGHGIWLDSTREGSDAVLVYAKPVPELLVAGAYISGRGTGTSNPALFDGSITGDANFYAALANYTFAENNTAGINVTFADDNASAIGGVVKNIRAFNTGITADGKLGAVSYKAEADWLTGRRLNTFGTKNYRFNAYAAMAGASVDVGAVKVGGEVVYGTGNHANDRKVLYNPGGAGVGSDSITDHAYFVPYGATSYNYAFLYNDKIGQGPRGAGGGNGYGDGFGGFGLANTSYIKLTAGMNPTDKLSVGAEVLYLRATGQQFGDQAKSLGWEADAKVGYKLYDNLNFNLTGGAFIPGAWYKFGGTQTKMSNAYGAEAKLVAKF